MQWICGCNLLLHKIESYQLSHQKTNGTLSNAVCKYTLSAQRNGPRNSPQSPIRLASGYTCIFQLLRILSISCDVLQMQWYCSHQQLIIMHKIWCLKWLLAWSIPTAWFDTQLSELSRSSSFICLNDYIAGKWHAGFHAAAHLPTNRGFDTFRGFLTSGPSNYVERGR